MMKPCSCSCKKCHKRTEVARDGFAITLRTAPHCGRGFKGCQS